MSLLEYFTYCYENPKKNHFILYSDPLEGIYFKTYTCGIVQLPV